MMKPIRECLLRYFRETEGFLNCIHQNVTGVVLVDVSGVLKDDVDKIIIMSQQCCCQKMLDREGPLVFDVSGEQCLDEIAHLICMGADQFKFGGNATLDLVIAVAGGPPS